MPLLERPSSRASVLLVHPGAPWTGSTLAMRMAESLLRGLLPLRTVSWEGILGQGSESSRERRLSALKRCFVLPVPIGTKEEGAEDRHNSEQVGGRKRRTTKGS